MSARPIALLTDFGDHDPFAGICRAVILGVDPAIPLIDLTHGIARQDVTAGAVALMDAAPYLPADCVTMAVVDPGVGGERRAVAVESADGRVFVGPDNGLLWPALEACGGGVAAYDIGNSPWRREPTSNTFHGRDIFAPVAARIATGARPEDGAETIDPGEIVPLELPRTTIDGDEISTAVIAVDAYGNARLGARADQLAGAAHGDRYEIDSGAMRRQAVFVKSYASAEAKEPLLLADSNGSLSIAINGGDAASELRLVPGTAVHILPT